MLRPLISCLALALSLAACKVPDPLYCDKDTPCKDPARPFCDLNGDYPASEGVGRTCIPDPNTEGDAGPSNDSGSTPDASGPRRIVRIESGLWETCAIFNDGGMRCWGDGMLGYGAQQDIGDDEVPRIEGDVPTGGRVVQAAIGDRFICALYAEGNVRCWGLNNVGQLGYGDTMIRGDHGDTPDKLPDVQVGGKVKQIVASSTYVCALLEGGDVRCWGSPQKGELGYPDGVGDDETPASHDPVDVGEPAVELAAGGNHTCALLESGRVRCWGSGIEGELGYGNVDDVGDDETPAQVGDVNVGGTVTQIVATGFGTCALLEGGSVRCWGGADDGELGYGNRDNIGDDESPASAGNVVVGGTVTQLSSAIISTCALLDNGTVRCWGRGLNGVLGYGNTNDIGDDEIPAAAGNVAMGGRVVALDHGSANRSHVCAILEDGGVRCWGRGGYGVLGYGNTENIGDDETPESVGEVEILDAN